MNHVYTQPVGVTPLLDSERRAIITAFTGDEIVLRVRARTLDGVPVSPMNSTLIFALADQRFSPVAEWTGRWHEGIELVPGDPAGDLVEIRIPDTVSSSLRRGSFTFALLVANKLGAQRRTLANGDLLLEYAPTSPLHSIPYKDRA